MADYKNTLHLPKTSFPMKANLTQKETETLKFWEKIQAYEAMVAANRNGERYVLHDGPPYANGHIHLGTALNKILKDIIIKHKNMRGYLAEYVPGWDCHGLPIEHNVAQELKAKGKTGLPALTVRRICRKYAEKFVDIQRKEFKRLGVFGVWEDPYLTIRPAYEAATARELGNFMAKGSVYRGKKPIYWCGSCKTALAEAEVEYADVTSPSIFVRFPLKGEGLEKVFPDANPEKTSIVIWTTTPWTLPANLAVAVHPDFEYVCVRAGDEFYILAKELLDACQEKFGWEGAKITALVPGKALEGLVARHPFYDRESKVVLADYVTLETGTGCVHTAPGHGREDYETGLRYGLEVLSPLDDAGCFLPEVEFFGGLGVFQADPKVIEKLDETGNLLAREKIRHSYPHCWRCKKPVIFRATTQWFISMETNGLREKALRSIDSEVAWIPAWGRERIHNMIATRPDWCISRQRTWGVPIIALLCDKCGEAYFDPGWVQSIVDRFETHETGCDYWFEAELSEITPKGLACRKCGASQWKKENDILDVWFDSGTSFAAVVEQRKECQYPADLYLEGSDQHRGWFHSSLLASIGTRGQAPYKTVLTHGYVVDGQGKKMSKSVGNVVAPQEIIDKYGAEILRVWTASVDYQDDVRISDESVRRLVDAYRRIRNTCRFILGNLNDFNPKEHATRPEDTLVLDRYALEIAKKTHERIQNAYDKFEFHKVFHTLHNFCVTDLSAFYLDIIKDRLYVCDQDSQERRSAQTGLWLILMLLLQDMAPILSFTAEEVYQHLPEAVKPSAASVFGLRLGPDPAYLPTEEQRQTFELARNVRSEVNKAIEPVRKSGEIGHSLDTQVTLYGDDKLLGELAAHDLDLKEMLIVSKISLRALSEAPEGIFTGEEVGGLKVEVGAAPGSKCERCWMYTEKPGTDSLHPTLCPRCSGVMAIKN